MTRGLVVILGKMGANFGAGMSGGLAYILDLNKSLCNMESILLEPVEGEDVEMLHELVKEHVAWTNSVMAKELLNDWKKTVSRFTKVFPKEYKAALANMAKTKEKTQEPDPAMEQTGSRGKDIEDPRPNSVRAPVKRRGFHEYSRKAMSYRPDKDRTMDWEEIYAAQGSKSQQWHSWMQTQTARCMDCGTPTCSTPNQGGGGCPLGNRIPTWNQLVHEGDWKRALERLLDTNNFPEFTGTTCPAPCEESCVLGINEKPVAIKSVELAIIEYGFSKGWIKPQPPQVRTRKRVCIIGSGPSGLAAAQQLNRAGHWVTVIERADRGGGLLMYGIPSMKLAKAEKVGRRLQLLKDEGIEFKYNTEVGKDVSLAELCTQNDAVIMATGATQWRDMRKVEGRHLKNIVQAMEFLPAAQKANMDSDAGVKGKPAPYQLEGKRVIVIGGGDTAVDCVATSVRLGARSVLQFSRRDVAPSTRPAHTPWPCWADTYRVDYAHSEVKQLHGRDPREYLVSTKAFKASADDPNRVGAVIATHQGGEGGGTVEYPAELVILAMGFTGPDKTADPAGMLQRDQHSNFLASYGEYQAEGSPWKNLFVSGDCRRGASLVVTAIAEGRDCASRVDNFLMGETNLPRAAPLAANPTFYQMPKKGDPQNQPGTVKRFQRRRQQKAEVSDAFERGLLVEPVMEEPEAEASAANIARARSGSLHRKATMDGADIGRQANTAPAGFGGMGSSSGGVPVWMAAGMGGLVAINVVLVGAVIALARKH